MTRPIRLVLADDTEPLRMLLRRVFDDDGRFEVVGEAADGVEALEQVRTHTPDLLLLDLSMPRMDGLEVLDRLRPLGLATKVIVLSGHAADSAAEASLERGALAYIEKGVRPLQLLTCVADIMASAEQGDHRPATIRSDEMAQEPADAGTGDERPTTTSARLLPPHHEPPLESLISQLVHDLRSPVGLAVGYLDLLRRKDLGTEPAVLIERISMALGHLDELVTTLGAYARVPRTPLAAQTVTLTQVCNAARNRLSETHNDLDRIQIEDPGATIQADPDALTEVVVQLLDNALRYGGVDPVVVRATAGEESVVVEVADRGPGLDADDAATLFTPFRRGAAARGNWGTGLGLALSARLVQAMDGRMWAEPRNPGGAVFAVELPAGRYASSD